MIAGHTFEDVAHAGTDFREGHGACLLFCGGMPSGAVLWYVCGPRRAAARASTAPCGVVSVADDHSPALEVIILRVDGYELGLAECGIGQAIHKCP
jgi:hypothetical protein